MTGDNLALEVDLRTGIFRAVCRDGDYSRITSAVQQGNIEHGEGLLIYPHPNVLVANPSYDPATPITNAVSVWLQIPEARLLIAEADGHQSLIVSRCAFEAQLAFLLDPSSTPPITICPD